MKTRIPAVLLALTILATGLFANGCTYMTKRGNDALDIFDLGVTVTPKLKPDFGVYFSFPGNLVIGGAYVDNAKLIGMGNRHGGVLDYENKSWGAVVWGSSKQGCGEFDARDPYQAREDQRNLTERPRFNSGPVRAMVQDDSVPPLQFVECDKGIHLGYIGVLANCRPLELFDFILGWTTLDFMCDDDADYRENVDK